MSKKRSPNFSSAEIQTLLDEVEKNKDIIFSKLSNIVTNSAKKRAWESICERINSCNSSAHTRTVEEIRKKWSSYTSDTKKKASQQRRESLKTGGGPPPLELNAMQDRVVGIIGNLPIDVIPGGHDTTDLIEKNGNFVSIGTESSDSNQSGMHAEAARITLDEPDNQPSLEASAERKRKPTRASSEGNYMQQLLEVEEQKLEIAKEKLEIKKRRLAIDEQRLALDQQRFQLELQRHQVYLAKYGVTFSVTDQNQ